MWVVGIFAFPVDFYLSAVILLVLNVLAIWIGLSSYRKLGLLVSIPAYGASFIAGLLGLWNRFMLRGELQFGLTAVFAIAATTLMYYISEGE